MTLQGNAAIHYCVSHCNFDTVSLLLDTEVCEAKQPNKAGYTPVMLAALAYVQSEEHRDIIRGLFHAGDMNTQAEHVSSTVCVEITLEWISRGLDMRAVVDI